MASRGTGEAMRDLGRIFREGAVAGHPDELLLERFLARGGEAAEAAFASLVERHGPMVLGVCRRALPDPRDAEDAFQATFLILARKAGSVRVGDSLGRWLYGVSRRVASRARARVGRRLDRELLSVVECATESEAPGERLDLLGVLDEELARLPPKYRDPLVLCYLEGQTHEAAARQLGWPVGTVRGRMARARDLLRPRLARRGLAPAVVLGGAPASMEAAVPLRLVGLTARVACRSATSARVASWAGWELASMTMARWKGVAGLFLIAGAICVAAASGAGSSPDHPPQRPSPESKAPATAREDRSEMVGTWTSEEPIQETIGGVPKPPRLVTTKWAIGGDTIAISDEGGFLARQYQYTLDPPGTPKAIDLKDPASGGTLAGIYRLDGDVLMIRYGLERAKDFKEGTFHKLTRRGRLPELLAPRFELAPGCHWAMAPGGGVPSSMGGGGIQFRVDRGPDGSLIVIMAYMKKGGPDPGPEMRPVAFDAQGRRHLPRAGEGGSSGSIAIPGAMLHQSKYRLDPADLPADKVATIGIEAVPSDVRLAAREAASIAAIEEAKARGIDLLPWPRVGEPYDFALEATDGRVLRPRDLRGKVVLIDFWETWCSPCMAKMPALKELYERRRGDGFEVIGVNFDHEPGRATRMLDTLGLTWPEVFVPADESTRELWETAAGIESLPRLLVIDRGGVLRYDGGSGEIEEQVTRWLRGPAPVPGR